MNNKVGVRMFLGIIMKILSPKVASEFLSWAWMEAWMEAHLVGHKSK